MSIMGRGSSDSEAPPFGSVALPSCVVTLLAPGCIADDAARIECRSLSGPVSVTRCRCPHHEPAAYEKSSDVTVFVAPRMAHMHNFASTRAMLWDRLAGWAAAV